MPEEQKPFIHQDGTTSPATPTPSAELLNTTALAKLVLLLEDDESIISSMDTVGLSDEMKIALSDELKTRRRAIETAQLLQESRVNTTVTALKALDPSMQALVSDVAIALATNPAGRQNLANALRKLIEGRS